ncbi:hypothetical protein V6N12_021662 [Hibiscus sabdariffa]|uniref:Serine aminopeptidase S33 domain-containing protein n=1 Tax=Hibiscus sabdariffa TaxID=183260 RepID=A0ABR2FSB7_9ROSI
MAEGKRDMRIYRWNIVALGDNTLSSLGIFASLGLNTGLLSGLNLHRSSYSLSQDTKTLLRTKRAGQFPVSRDPEVLVAKYSDPLVYTGPLPVRTGCLLLRVTSYLQQNLNRFTVPFLVLHGTGDTVTDPQASQKLY